MMHARPFVFSFAGAAALASSAVLLVAGCGGRKPQPGDTSSGADGTVALELVLAAGETLATAKYTLTGPHGFTRSSSLDVRAASAISARIGGIPAGRGYAIELSATASEAGTSCGGSASFSVRAGQTTPVSVSVECRPQAAGAEPACAGDCDDGNPCTTDTCTSDLACTHATIADGTLCQGGDLKVKILGFNDFHGQISAGKTVGGRPVGSAAVMSAYLKAAQAGIEDQTLIVHAGDHVGASPASSALLKDEPSIQWLNTLANAACSYEDKTNPACNVVGTLGNHEFDEGKTELLRLLNGGNHASGPFLEDPYEGARYPVVSANVIDAATGRPLVAPYVIKQVRGIPIAFVGAVLEATPTIVTPAGVAGLTFLDEADAANSYVPELQAQGVHALVLLIHQGGSQSSYATGTNTSLTNSALHAPELLNVVTRLDPEFDLVVSGHAHGFTNLFVTTNADKQVLVTQAFSAGTAYADIDLTLDPVSKDVVSESARIVTTFADVAPGNAPDPAAAALTAAAEAEVMPVTSQVVGFASVSYTRDGGSTGEEALGDLIADSQNLAAGTEFAFMNPGGIRADLVVPAGGADIIWNDLFTMQPFGNTLVSMNLTGAQIKAVLEQQWHGSSAKILQISGLGYTWDDGQPQGSRIVEMHTAAGTPVDANASYFVTCNDFLATGGDGFTAFTGGTTQVSGPIDLDAMVAYTESHNPLPAPSLDRIQRLQ